MKTIREYTSRLIPHLPKVTFALFILQPIVDVMSFWVVKLGVGNTVTLALRMLMLAVTVLIGFAVSEKKTVYYIAALISVFIGAGHIFAAWQFGYTNIFTDMTNYIRVLNMPWTTIALISCIKANRDCYGAIKSGILTCLLIIFSVQILAVATGTEPHTYKDGAGYIGWFSNTNSQSSILTVTAPVAIAWLYRRRGLKSPLFWFTLIGTFAAMYFFGTRLSYAGMIAMFFGLGGSIIIINPKDWNRAAAFLLAGVAVLALMPTSPMMKHQEQYYGVQTDRQENIDSMLDASTTDAPATDTTDTTSPDTETPETSAPVPPAEPTKEELILRLTPIYEFYAADFVEIFGAEQTIEMFDYTTDILKITATRPKKLIFAKLLMENSPPSSLFFGVELARFTVNGNIYDVENDLHGVYYLYGAVGLLAMLAFIFYFIFLIIRALCKDPKRYFSLDAASWGIALIMCLGHVYCTAGVLRRPSAAFYLAAIFAAVYYLTVLHDYESGSEV